MVAAQDCLSRLKTCLHIKHMLILCRYNWVTDRSAFAVHNLVASTSTLTYLNLSQCALTNDGLNSILAGITTSRSMLFFIGKTIWPQSKPAAAVAAAQEHFRLSKLVHENLTKNVNRVYGVTYTEFMENDKRWLVNDRADVRKIDSVYRNRDAGLARRGLMKLDKLWDEDDETLKEVMKGAVGPVCTKRKVLVPAT